MAALQREHTFDVGPLGFFDDEENGGVAGVGKHKSKANDKNEREQQYGGKFKKKRSLMNRTLFKKAAN